MDVLLVLIPIALLLGALGLGAFLWSLKSGQFDDPDGAAGRILFDDDLPPGDRPPGDLQPEGLPPRAPGKQN